MKSYFLCCPNCRSHRQEILFPAFYKVTVDGYQNIVMCRDCGAVFRNPVIPDLRHDHYKTANAWFNDAFVKSHENLFAHVAKIIASNVNLSAGDMFIDIGPGPGWLSKELSKKFPDSQPILLEPGTETGKVAKGNNPTAILIPSQLDEVDVTVKFPLVVSCGVDYLFSDARASMKKIREILSEDGLFYIHRNVFVDQSSYWRNPIYDLEDMFGQNSMMNYWPGRDQYVGYLSQFFDVIDAIDYNFEEYVFTDKIRFRCDMRAVLCRKKTKADALQPSFYDENYAFLSGLAPRSSLNDFSILAQNGVKTVTIVGDGSAGPALLKLVADSGLFKVNRALTVQGDLVADNQWLPLTDNISNDSDAFLVASETKQEGYCEFLRTRGIDSGVLPCLRTGLPMFESTTSLGRRIQVKAFLPAQMKGLYPQGVVKEGVGASLLDKGTR